MLQNPKPEQVKTELSAVALCVAAVVAFLSAAMAFKGNFTLIEFWIFVNAGMAWFTWAFSRFWTMHVSRAELEELRKLHHSQRIFIDMQSATIRLLNENMEAFIEAAQLVKKCPVSPDEPEGRPPDDGNGDNKQCNFFE